MLLPLFPTEATGITPELLAYWMDRLNSAEDCSMLKLIFITRAFDRTAVYTARMMSEVYPEPSGPNAFRGRIVARGATRCTIPATMVPCPKAPYFDWSTTAAVD